MAIQLNRGNEPGRNEPCFCGSGLNYKKCHGDESKRIICNQIANEKMVELIQKELNKKPIIEGDKNE